jgi:hypothetical protein
MREVVMTTVSIVLLIVCGVLGFLISAAWNRYIDAKDMLVYPLTRHVFERGAAHGVIMAMLLAAFGGTVAAFIKVVR